MTQQLLQQNIIEKNRENRLAAQVVFAGCAVREIYSCKSKSKAMVDVVAVAV